MATAQTINLIEFTGEIPLMEDGIRVLKRNRYDKSYFHGKYLQTRSKRLTRMFINVLSDTQTYKKMEDWQQENIMVNLLVNR